MDDKMFPLIVVVALVAIVGLVAILIGGTNKSTLVVPGVGEDNVAGQAYNQQGIREFQTIGGSPLTDDADDGCQKVTTSSGDTCVTIPSRCSGTCKVDKDGGSGGCWCKTQ